MLTDETKIKWVEFFKKEADELGIADDKKVAFVESAIFGIQKYSLSLIRRIHSYGEALMNQDVDGDNWIMDSTVRMFIQHVEPDATERTKK